MLVFNRNKVKTSRTDTCNIIYKKQFELIHKNNNL